MIALGIDPGFANIGIALIDGDNIVCAESFHKDKGTTDESHMEYLVLQLDAWIRGAGAELVAYEQQWRAQVGQVMRGRGYASMHYVNEVVGIVRAHAFHAKLLTVEVTPAEAKRAVGLTSKAEKSHVKDAVRRLYPGFDKRLNQHSADAVTIARAGIFAAKERWNGLG